MTGEGLLGEVLVTNGRLELSLPEQDAHDVGAG